MHLFECLGLVNLQDSHGVQGRGYLARSTITGFGRETRTVPPSGGVSWAQVHHDRSLHYPVSPGSPAIEGSEDGGDGRAASGRERGHPRLRQLLMHLREKRHQSRAWLWGTPRSEKPINQRRGFGTGRSVDLQPDTHSCPDKHGRQLWVWCGGGDNTRGGQPHHTFIIRGRKPIPRCCDRHPILRWSTELNAGRPVGRTSDITREPDGTFFEWEGGEALTVTLRSPRVPAGGSLLKPEKPTRVSSERKAEIAAKSCSYALNRRMSHPPMHLQRVGCPDTEDNDRVRHPQTGNDHNQKDTDETASWKRRSFRICSFSCAQGICCWEGILDLKLILVVRPGLTQYSAPGWPHLNIKYGHMYNSAMNKTPAFWAVSGFWLILHSRNVSAIHYSPLHKHASRYLWGSPQHKHK